MVVLKVVKASRGLRQGDPLSPFLFTLVADALSRMLMRAEERNMMEGFRVGRNRTRVSHLQFADDTIFFSNSREEELQTLKSLLLVFGHISGLKVNLNKSSIYGINLDQAHLSRLAVMLDCKASGWLILYLGLPLGGNPKACGFWDPVIERISRVGEGKRDHLVRWDVVCKPKTIGGLGLGNISWRNLALLGKWLWRYPREGSALWHQVILSIYGSHSNGWDANTLVRWSHRCPWKAIAQVFQGFSLITRVVVDKNISISSVLGPSRPFLWNLNFRRNLSDFEIKDLEGLMRSLDDLYLSPSNFPSKFVWNSQVPFKVKSFVWLFQLAKMDWVPLRSIYDMMTIKFKGFGNSKRGIVLWQAASIALIRVVWWEKNARIFEDKVRNSEFLWDSIVFLASLWAFCSKAFKGIPLNVIQLDWIAACTP
ncbi:putative mitochondrial protein [Vitis vinifera]|uniref:Putative mitochondrial protein n=1 Tax=Vitis vinifera TaxID=29760 RepID=A0A438KP64_VITVI|nr:putative mitochondrial protein [Vitis vinifera]